MDVLRQSYDFFGVMSTCDVKEEAIESEGEVSVTHLTEDSPRLLVSPGTGTIINGSDWFKSLQLKTARKSVCQANKQQIEESANKQTKQSNGLAEQLRRLQLRDRSAVRRWHNQQIKPSALQVWKSIQLEVIGYESRYSLHLVKCVLCKKNDSGPIGTDLKVSGWGRKKKGHVGSSKKSQDEGNLDKRLVMFPASQSDQLNLQIGSILKIFPPWQQLELNDGKQILLCTKYYHIVQQPEVTMATPSPRDGNKLTNVVTTTWNCPCVEGSNRSRKHCSSYRFPFNKEQSQETVPVTRRKTTQGKDSNIKSPQSADNHPTSHLFTVSTKSCNPKVIVTKISSEKSNIFDSLLKSIESCRTAADGRRNGYCVIVSFSGHVHRAVTVIDSSSKTRCHLLVEDICGSICEVQLSTKSLNRAGFTSKSFENNTFKFSGLTVNERVMRDGHEGLFTMVDRVWSGKHDRSNSQKGGKAKPPDFCYILQEKDKSPITIEKCSSNILPCKSPVYLQLSEVLKSKATRRVVCVVKLFYIHIKKSMTVLHVADYSLDSSQSYTMIRVSNACYCYDKVSTLSERVILILRDLLLIKGELHADEYTSIYLPSDILHIDALLSREIRRLQQMSTYRTENHTGVTEDALWVIKDEPVDCLNTAASPIKQSVRNNGNLGDSNNEDVGDSVNNPDLRVNDIEPNHVAPCMSEEMDHASSRKRKGQSRESVGIDDALNDIRVIVNDTGTVLNVKGIILNETGTEVIGTGTVMNYLETRDYDTGKFLNGTRTDLNDTGTVMIDKGTGVIDTGTDLIDIGTDLNDTGTVMIDKGTVVIDTGTDLIDIETDVNETGTGDCDAGTFVIGNRTDLYDTGTDVIETGIAVDDTETGVIETGTDLYESGTGVIDTGTCVNDTETYDSGTDDYQAAEKINVLFGEVNDVNHGFFKLFTEYKLVDSTDEASILIVPANSNGCTRFTAVNLFKCLLGRKTKIISNQWIKNSLREGEVKDMDTYIIKSADGFGKISAKEHYRQLDFQIKGQHLDDIRLLLKKMGGTEVLTASKDTIIVCADGEISTSRQCVPKTWVYQSIIDGKINPLPKSFDHANDSDENDTSEMIGVNSLEVQTKIRVQPRSNAKGKILKKKNACIYCGALYTKLSRHFAERHKTETEVAKIMNLRKNSIERNRAWMKLAIKGNFAHNQRVKEQGSGFIIPKRRPKKNASDFNYLPCEFCLAYFMDKDLWKHHKNCISKPKDLKSGGGVHNSRLLIPKQCPEQFYKHVVSKLQEDNITSRIKSDALILDFGQRLYNTTAKYGHNLRTIGQKLRELARCVIAIHEQDNMVTTLSDVLNVAKWQVLTETVKKEAGFDIEKNVFTKPSFAISCGKSLRRCAKILQSKFIVNGDELSRERIEHFIKKYQDEWNKLIEERARENLDARKSNKVKLIHLVEDLTKLLKHIIAEVDEVKISDNISANKKAYARMCKLTLAQILTFNRTRGFEVQRLTKEAFSKASLNPLVEEEVKNCMSKFEKELCTSHVRVETTGKRGRKVALLFTPVMMKNVAMILNLHKSLGFSSRYIFKPIMGSTTYSGTQALREIANEAKLTYFYKISSFSLRKQLATLTQVVCLSENSQDILAKFIGHDCDINGLLTSNCSPERIMEVAKVTRLIHLMNAGKISSDDCETLEDIDVNLTVDNESDSDEDDASNVDSAKTPSHGDTNVDSEQTSTNSDTNVGSAQTSTNDDTNVGSAQTLTNNDTNVGSTLILSYNSTNVDSAQTSASDDTSVGLIPMSTDHDTNVGASQTPTNDDTNVGSSQTPANDDTNIGSKPTLASDNTKVESTQTPANDNTNVGSTQTPVSDDTNVGSTQTPVNDDTSVGSKPTPANDDTNVGSTQTPANDNSKVGSTQTPANDNTKVGSTPSPANDDTNVGSTQSPANDDTNVGSTQTPVNDNTKVGSTQMSTNDDTKIGSTQSSSNDYTNFGFKPMSAEDDTNVGSIRTPAHDDTNVGFAKHITDDDTNVGLTQTQAHDDTNVGVAQISTNDDTNVDQVPTSAGDDTTIVTAVGNTSDRTRQISAKGNTYIVCSLLTNNTNNFGHARNSAMDNTINHNSVQSSVMGNRSFDYSTSTLSGEFTNNKFDSTPTIAGDSTKNASTSTVVKDNTSYLGSTPMSPNDNTNFVGSTSTPAEDKNNVGYTLTPSNVCSSNVDSTTDADMDDINSSGFKPNLAEDNTMNISSTQTSEDNTNNIGSTPSLAKDNTSYVSSTSTATRKQGQKRNLVNQDEIDDEKDETCQPPVAKRKSRGKQRLSIDWNEVEFEDDSMDETWKPPVAKKKSSLSVSSSTSNSELDTDDSDDWDDQQTNARKRDNSRSSGSVATDDMQGMHLDINRKLYGSKWKDSVELEDTDYDSDFNMTEDDQMSDSCWSSDDGEQSEGNIPKKGSNASVIMEEGNNPADIAMSSDITSSGVKIQFTKNKDRKRKLHFCLFCGAGKPYIRRHYFSRHKKEPDVKEILDLLLNSSERKLKLLKLRNAGDFKHNTEVLIKGDGILVTSTRHSNATSAEDFLPCTSCLGFYTKSSLSKHSKVCPFAKKSKKSGIIQPAPSRFLHSLVPVSESLKENVLAKMAEDEVTKVVHQDKLIVKLGEKLYSKHRNFPHLYNYISLKMRELARLLISTRQHDSGITSFYDLISSEKFPIVVDATKSLCLYDKNSNKYGKPGLALCIGKSLRKCAKIYKKESDSFGNIDQMKQAEEFLSLCENEWKEEISSMALHTLSTKKMNKGKMLPLSQDLMKLQLFFHTKNESLRKSLEESFSKSDWELLNQICLAQLVLYNRRRGGVAERITVEGYMTGKKSEAGTKKVEDSLSSTEKALLKTHSIVEVSVKDGQNVPVLLPPFIEKNIDLLLEWRSQAGVHEENEFLFARPIKDSKAPLRCSHVLVKFTKEAKLTTPQNIRSIKLSKHVATLYQILNMQQKDLEILASLVNKDTRVQRSFDGLSQETLKVAKIGFLLTAFNNGTISQYNGMSLDDIKLDKNGDFSVDNDVANDDIDNVDNNECPDINENDRLDHSNESKKAATSTKAATSGATVRTKGQKGTYYTKRQWSEAEESFLKSKFKKYLSGTESSVHKTDMLEAQEACPKLSTRTLPQIRAKLNNMKLGK